MDKRLELTPQQIAQKYVDEIKTRRLKYKFWLTIMLLMICQTVCGQFVYDRSNMTIGKIDSNGYVYNRSNMYSHYLCSRIFLLQ